MERGLDWIPRCRRSAGTMTHLRFATKGLYVVPLIKSEPRVGIERIVEPANEEKEKQRSNPGWSVRFHFGMGYQSLGVGKCFAQK